MTNQTTTSVTSTDPSKVALVNLTANDLPELAAFIAAQSGKPPAETLSHLTWLLLENPARHPQLPLGCGARSTTGALVGYILYLPQMFVLRQTPLLIVGSSCFYVDESHRGSGGPIFLKFSRVANQWPLFGNSANAVAAQLWKARGAKPIPHSDHELLGIVHWPPVIEELAARRGLGQPLSRVAGAASSWLDGIRGLHLTLNSRTEDSSIQLDQLSGVEEAMEVIRFWTANAWSYLTALRNEPFIRWRYFSHRDPSIALFAFQDQDRQPFLVTVNERPRGHRGQIRSLNILDIFPKSPPGATPAIVAALHEKFRDNIHMIVVRCQDVPSQKALIHAGFHRRDFESPNGWLLDKQGLVPAQDWYLVPADGDWII